MLGSQLRSRRVAAGLTQAQLAGRAGVSRQLVVAAETGRNTPAVDAALALATVLGCTVEELFAEPTRARTVHSVLGGALAPDTPVRVGRVGDRLVGTELAGNGLLGGGWATADGVARDGRFDPFAGATPAGAVLAGCEPALAVAERLLAGRGDASLLAISVSTTAALRALGAGSVHGAVVHGPPGSLPAAPCAVRRWHFARWQVGLAVAPDARPATLDALLGGSVVVAQREPGAASQQALERALRRAGDPPLRGPVAAGHLDAARIAAATGCAAVTTEGAARAFGLRFWAIEEHAVELWIDRRWVHSPGVLAVGELFGGRALRDRIARFGGYDLARCGDPIDAE